MAYSELIKNFKKIRAYMQDFYIYGFKTRYEYDQKSARSYDDERRRIESWLGDHVHSAITPEGKNVWLSIDSRRHQKNPLFQAWKSKSFTDGDITLHFLLMDILYSPDISLSLAEIIGEVDNYLFETDAEVSFDESTIRKKLQEYTRLGIIRPEKRGRQMVYSRMPDTDISELGDLLSFFSETVPCGVVGSYLLDKLSTQSSPFYFKHHYITQTMDSGVLAALLDAIQEKCSVTVQSEDRRMKTKQCLSLLPLKIYISTQNGRQYLIAWQENPGRFMTLRLDRLSEVRAGEKSDSFDTRRIRLKAMEGHMWGVNVPPEGKETEHVEFDIFVGPEEPFILRRLEREKRCGHVEQLDETHYRFWADVYDAAEMLPWIRSFLCRIVRLEFSNKEVEERFRSDLRQMYCMYGLEGEEVP